MTTIIRYEVAARINSSTAEIKRQWFNDADEAMEYYNRLKRTYNHVTMYGLNENGETQILLSHDAVAAVA